MEPAVDMRYRNAENSVQREATVLARALTAAAALVDRTVAAEQAHRVTLQRAATARNWYEMATAAALGLGLDPEVRATPGRAEMTSALAITRGTGGELLLVVGTASRRFYVTRFDERGERRSRVTYDELVRWTADQPWVFLEPLLALDPISAQHDPELADRPWRRLRAFLRLDHRELLVVLVYAVVIGGLTLATPIAVQALVNTVAFGAVFQPLVILTVMLLAGLSFWGLLTGLEAYVVEVIQRRVFVRVADDFGRRLPSLRPGALEGQYGPELVNRFFDVLTIQKSMSVLLLDGLSLALQTFIGMLLLGFYHPLLLAFDIALMGLFVGVLALGRGAVESADRESAAKYQTAAWLEDVARTLNLFRGQSSAHYAATRTDLLCRDYLSARKAHFRVLLRQIAAGIGLQVFATVALLGVGGWLVMNRQLTLGQLVAAELVIAAMGSGFTKLGKNLEKLYDLNVGVGKLARVVDLPSERRGGEPLPADGPLSVVLHGVELERGGRSLVRALDFELSAGERVAVRGPSGAGKSTLLDVLAALHPTWDGSVRMAGLDLRRADLQSIRDHVALVRDVEFTNRPVLDNLRMGNALIDEAKIWEILQRLRLDDTVLTLPEGIETPLHPRGGPLSQTQAKRMVLARALAHDPKLLLLDRALDGLGLDDDGFDELLDYLWSDDAPWSIVVVSDDPRVLARCDRILDLGGEELAA